MGQNFSYPANSPISMGFHASLSSARSAHSNAHIDHSETNHEIANLPVRMTNLETEMKDCKTEIKDFKTEMKDFKTEIFHKFDLFAVKLDNNLEKRLSTYAKDQQKEFSQFYSRCLLAVIGIAVLSIGGAWILPMKEAERLDVEAKKRAIIQERTDKILQGK